MLLVPRVVYADEREPTPILPDVAPAADHVRCRARGRHRRRPRALDRPDPPRPWSVHFDMQVMICNWREAAALSMVEVTLSHLGAVGSVATRESHAERCATCHPGTRFDPPRRLFRRGGSHGGE